MPSLFPEPAEPEPAESPKTPARAGKGDWILAHCDGGARGNPGPAGFGAVLADAAGHKLAELSEFLGHKTNNVAEYSGLLGCLQWALDHGYKRLRVVSDSELMVKQIQGKYKVNSPDLRPLWEEARRRIAKLDGFEISHALRHKNQDADRLANEAMDRGMGKAAVSGAGQSSSITAERARTSQTPAPGAIKGGAVPQKATAAPQMLRGFTRDGTIHLLGGTVLPDGIFVKVIVE